MPNEILVQDAAGSSLSSIAFGVAGSFNPADDGTNWTDDLLTIDELITLAGVADGAGRQSDKIDLGALRARQYAVLGCVDYTGETPTPSGSTVDYYWAPSTHATPANGNVAGNSGVDADATQAAGGWVPGGLTLAEFLTLCLFIGSLVISDDAAVQNGMVGVFSPPTRRGQLIVVNNGGDAFEDDDVEMHQVLIPWVDEVQ